MGHHHVEPLDDNDNDKANNNDIDNSGGEPVRMAPPVAALVRRPSMRVRHEVMSARRGAGFEDILPAHLGVFQYPGPDGQRPGILAARNHASKQAMNHLLHQLEDGGYILRERHLDDRRIRVVRLTARGRAALEVIDATTAWVEESWVELLGEDYVAVRRGMARLEVLLLPTPDVG